MALVEKEVLLKAIYDPSFAKGAFSELPLAAFTEKDEYKEVYQAIKEHYRLNGTTLTERALLHEVEDRLLRRKTKEDKIDNHLEVVHDLYTIERSESDDDIVEGRIQEFVRGKLVYKAMSDFLSSGKDFGDEEQINKLVPELQRISTMSVAGNDSTLVDFFDDVEKKKEEYSKLEKDKFATGFQAIDRISGGGLARGEVGMIIAATGGGKCVTGDTLVNTSQGLLKIGEIPGYYKVNRETGESKALVASYDTEGNYVPRETSHWYNMGYSKTIKITTKHGVEIEGTPEHPLLVMNRRGNLEFVELQNMKMGEMITLAKPDMWSDSDIINRESAYTLGLTDALSTENTGKEILGPVLQSTKETVLRYIHGIIDVKGVLHSTGLLEISLPERKIAKQLQTVFINLGVLPIRKEHPNRDVVTLLFDPKQAYELTKLLDFEQIDFELISQGKMSHDKLERKANSATTTLAIPNDVPNHINDNLLFDPIVSFEESEAEVFDFTVPETHSFVANGIVSHNTTWAVQQINNYTKRGMNTLYIALEEHLGRMLLKIEQNMLGVPKSALFDSDGNLRDDVFEGAQSLYKDSINLGKLYVSKHRPQEVTIADIEQVILDIKFRKGVNIDAVVIDYPDLMRNTHARNGVSESDAGGKLLEDIRALADKHQYVCWVLSQLNREGWGQDVRTAQAIEGSKRKLNAVEIAFTMNQNPEEFENGMLRIHIDKMRYSNDQGYSRMQYFRLDRDGLRIRDETPEEIEEHKGLIGESTGPARKEVKDNDKLMERIASINSTVGGK